jgi:hypothetical protein
MRRSAFCATSSARRISTGGRSTDFDAEKIAALAIDNDGIAFHFFLQYHLHLQLQDATAHAHAAGLVVKGDIAIGVYRHGADVWQEPELFHMDMQAGAPPDPFAAKGQNWGFPTYNWPRMAADGFAWWKRRFAQMGEITLTRSALTTSSDFSASGASRRTRSKASSVILSRRLRLSRRNFRRAESI